MRLETGRGTCGYVLYKTEVAQGELGVYDAIARELMAKAGREIPDDHGVYVVICRYRAGYGVKWHRDDDYKSDCRGIVSLSPMGTAKFRVKLHPNEGMGHVTVLSPGDAVVFDGNLWRRRHKPPDSTSR